MTAPDATVDVAALEERIRRSPFHTWLDLRVLDATPTTLRMRSTWRTEWENGTEQRVTHGGILAALLDLAADWVIACGGRRPAPTLDFSVHYLSAAGPGDLMVDARIVKSGRSVTVAEAEVSTLDGRRLAVGRGTYASFAVADTSAAPRDGGAPDAPQPG